MLNILIADDSLILRRVIKNIVEMMGHKVVAEANNGLEAIENHRKFKPDLITLDITMPGVGGVRNGIEALNEIRKNDKDVKVLMITSHGEEALVMEAISRGANGYMLKPFTMEKMQNWLTKLNLITIENSETDEQS